MHKEMEDTQARFTANVNELVKILTRVVSNANAVVEANPQLKKELADNGITILSPVVLSMMSIGISALGATNVIKFYIDNTHAECWDQIRTENEDFFYERLGSVFNSDTIKQFSNINPASVGVLFKLRGPDGQLVVTVEERKLIWRILKGLVRLSIKYILIARKTVPFYPEIDIPAICAKWEYTPIL